jgi:hypothetical protein
MRLNRLHRRALLAVPAAVVLMLAACGGDDDSPIATNPPPATPLAEQAACQSLTPASQGGPMPEGDTVVIRWLGTSNFEVAYHGKIILMDTYYNRPARTRSIGFTVDQVKKADAILIGHAHSDHISDVSFIAAQTGAQVYGSAITTTEAIKLGVPATQTVTVKGDNTEHFQFGDITVQPTHIVHSSIESGLGPALKTLYDTDGLGPLTADEAAQSASVTSRGSNDPNLVTLGTTGFTLTLASGFKIVWFDSVGGILPEEADLAKQLGEGIDVGIFPWTPHPIAETQLSYTFQHISLFKPKLYLPTHHDHIWGAWLDNGLEPLFMKIRDELPGTSYLSPLYRSPVCINTSGPNRGENALKY